VEELNAIEASEAVCVPKPNVSVRTLRDGINERGRKAIFDRPYGLSVFVERPARIECVRRQGQHENQCNRKQYPHMNEWVLAEALHKKGG
jgi:hypothetical protein